MGCVQQAVLEFDEEVQAPWRPRLVSVPAVAARRLVRCGTPVPPQPVEGGRLPAARLHRPAARRSVAGAARARRPSRRGRSGRRGGRRASGRRGPPRAAAHSAGPAARGRAGTVPAACCSAPCLGSLIVGRQGEGLRLAGVSSVVVESGDTLWSIAAAVAGGDDVRIVVDRIQELNGLEGRAGARPGPAGPVTEGAAGPSRRGGPGAETAQRRRAPRQGNRSTTCAVDFVNPQCGRVYPLLPLGRIRSSGVRRNGEPSSGIHQQAAGRRGLSGRSMVVR